MVLPNGTQPPLPRSAAWKENPLPVRGQQQLMCANTLKAPHVFCHKLVLAAVAQPLPSSIRKHRLGIAWSDSRQPAFLWRSQKHLVVDKVTSELLTSQVDGHCSGCVWVVLRKLLMADGWWCLTISLRLSLSSRCCCVFRWQVNRFLGLCDLRGGRRCCRSLVKDLVKVLQACSPISILDLLKLNTQLKQKLEIM